MVRIEYLPSFDPETGEPVEPVVSVTYDPDFDQTTIALNGAAVAELDGDAGIGAEDIDQPQGLGLAATENPSIGQFLDLVAGQLTPFGDNIDEHVGKIGDDGFRRLARGR
mgnify:CR=1 FL=1